MDRSILVELLCQVLESLSMHWDGEPLCGWIQGHKWTLTREECGGSSRHEPRFKLRLEGGDLVHGLLAYEVEVHRTLRTAGSAEVVPLRRSTDCSCYLCRYNVLGFAEGR